MQTKKKYIVTATDFLKKKNYKETEKRILNNLNGFVEVKFWFPVRFL